jgi:hypothetical protein
MTNNRKPKSVSSFWRTAAVAILGVLIGAIVLSSASAGSKKTVLGKTHTYIEGGSVSGVGDSEQVSIPCPSGEKATGGGVNFVSNNPSATIVWDEPLVKGDNLTAASDGKNPAANGWAVRVVSSSAGTTTFEVGAVCAKLVKVG